MNKDNTSNNLWKNENFKSIIFAISIVVVILGFLYIAENYINSSLLDFGLIGGGFIGLVGIFFPEFLHKYVNFPIEKPYDKKDAWKHRLWGAAIVLIGIAFYIYKRVYR